MILRVCLLFLAGMLVGCLEIPEPRCAQANCIALTFDDGPGPYTAHLLDILKAADARATFFVLGERVARSPELVARMVAEGHEVGNHSWNHPVFPLLSESRIRQQVSATDQAIFDATGGYSVLSFRPPYGSFSPRVAAIVPYAPTMWDIDTRDWESRNTAAITRLARRARPGSIILLHDINPHSIRAIPAIIEALRAKGFVFATVHELAQVPRP